MLGQRKSDRIRREYYLAVNKSETLSCVTMDRTGDHHFKGNKPGQAGHELNDLTHMME